MLNQRKNAGTKKTKTGKSPAPVTNSTPVTAATYSSSLLPAIKLIDNKPNTIPIIKPIATFFMAKPIIKPIIISIVKLIFLLGAYRFAILFFLRKGKC
jgi:hypothetical protein